MKTQYDDDKDRLSAQYSESVERERDAWQALQAHPPGTPERARAWDAWTEAIVQTNHAWRRLNVLRFGDPSRRAAAVQGDRHAGA